MGTPAPAGVESGLAPPVGDQATRVVQSTFTAVGTSPPLGVRGSVNVEIWGSYNSQLTTVVGSANGTLASAGLVAAGNSINAVNVPPGATVGSMAGAVATMVMPIQTWYGTFSTFGSGITGLDPALDRSALVGATVISPYFPAGTTVTSVNASPGVLNTSAPPTSNPPTPQLVPIGFRPTGNAIRVAAADTTAQFTGWEILFVGTVQLEKSFDGGRTWLPCNIGSTGVRASWAAGTPVSITVGEAEKFVMYRLNCLVFGAQVAGTTMNYRLSESAVASESLSLASVI